MRLRALTPAIGAVIEGVDLSRPLSSDQLAEIRAIWLERLVIVLRGQSLSPAQQLAFAEQIGTPDIYPFLKGLPGFPMITPVLKKEDETANFGGVWHSDTTYQPAPPMATMLYALELPPSGGDTLFANQYLAWERLSDGLKAMLGQMRAISVADKAAVSATRTARLAEDGTDIAPDSLVGRHPVCRVHPETGRPCLFVNPAHTLAFDGWTVEESAPLLAFLYQHQIAEEFQCRLIWQPGDLALWDNRCSLHYPVNDYHGYRRLLHRITLKGDVPRPAG